MSGQRDIAIVGAGIGGLALAVALRSKAIPCRLFEKATEFTDHGAGIQVSPNATRLLSRLGYAERVDNVAVRPECLEIADGASGRRLVRVALGAACEERFGAPLLTMRRHALHGVLRQALATDAIVMAAHLTSVTTVAQRTVLSFRGMPPHEADVIIGADGIHSTVRARFDEDPPVFSGKAVYRGVITAGALRLAEPAIRIWTGPGKHCIVYPVNRDGTMSFAALVASAEDPESATRSPAEALRHLRKAYDGWNRDVHELFQAAESLRCSELVDRPPLGTWVSSRVALLGDAAHPMLPVLAQGANCAIEDAYVLAASLAESWPDSVESALRRYEALRAPRASRLQVEARARLERLTPPGPSPGRRLGRGRASVLDDQTWIFGYDAHAAVPDRENAPTGGS